MVILKYKQYNVGKEVGITLDTKINGQLLFDESHLPYIIKMKKEIYHHFPGKLHFRIAFYIFLSVILFISIIIILYSPSFEGKLFGASAVIIIIIYPTFEIISLFDDKKDLRIYDTGMTIPNKPLYYVLKRDNWFVPFDKIESIKKGRDCLRVKFKENFSEERYILFKEIYDWSKFINALEGKVILDFKIMNISLP